LKKLSARKNWLPIVILRISDERFNGFDFWEEQIPQRLRSTTAFAWQSSESGQTLQIDRDAGPSMSA
jgi:hypothetical protein